MKTSRIVSLAALMCALVLAVYSFPTASNVPTPDATAISGPLFETAVAPVTVQPEIFQAVYQPAEVYIGNDATIAHAVEHTAVPRIPAPTSRPSYPLEVEYAYIGPPTYGKGTTGTRHKSTAYGFAGLGANHFARADV